eukprot:GILJ01009457.1.p1 GENE.GILJ01009457.1~~GILJ01009457.1.p1  ORF type:complete len:805 (+),score=153.94 GILJ01009457.1:192-2606(+)
MASETPQKESLPEAQSPSVSASPDSNGAPNSAGTTTPSTKPKPATGSALRVGAAVFVPGQFKFTPPAASSTPTSTNTPSATSASGASMGGPVAFPSLTSVGTTTPLKPSATPFLPPSASPNAGRVLNRVNKFENGSNFTMFGQHENASSSGEEEEEDEDISSEDDDTQPKRTQYTIQFLLQFKNMCITKPQAFASLSDVPVIIGNQQTEQPKPKPDRRHKTHNEKGRTPKQAKFVPAPVQDLEEVKLHTVENRWIPNSSPVTATDEYIKKARGLLNKLTPEKFEKIWASMDALRPATVEDMRVFMELIFDKAVTEHSFTAMYAELCVRLVQHMPKFEDPETGKPIAFKRMLLNKCQKEFETDPTLPATDSMTAEEKEETEFKMRKRMFGNIHFIGELFKRNLLTTNTMHECVCRLLSLENPVVEDIEQLVKLMRTIGLTLEHSSKELMDKWFLSLQELQANEKLVSRVRFMIKDLLELRENNWVERRKAEGPKTLAAVHAEASLELARQSSTASNAPSLSRQSSRNTPANRNRREKEKLTPSPAVAQDGEWETVGGKKGKKTEMDSHSKQKNKDNRRGGGPSKGGSQDVRNAPRSHYSRVPTKEAPAHTNINNAFAALASDRPAMIRATSEDEVPSTPSTPQKETIEEGQRSEQRSSQPSTPLSTDKKAQPLETLEKELVSISKDLLYRAIRMEEAVTAVKELNDPRTGSLLVDKAVTVLLDCREGELPLVCELFADLFRENLLTSADFVKGMTPTVEILADLAIDVPLAPKFIRVIIESAQQSNLIGSDEADSLLSMCNSTQS